MSESTRTKRLNKAELYAVRRAQEEVTQALAVFHQKKAVLAELLVDIGLDPNLDHDINPEGLVVSRPTAVTLPGPAAPLNRAQRRQLLRQEPASNGAAPSEAS